MPPLERAFFLLIFRQTQPTLTWRIEYANGKNDHVLFYCHSICMHSHVSRFTMIDCH